MKYYDFCGIKINMPENHKFKVKMVKSHKEPRKSCDALERIGNHFENYDCILT